MGAYCYRLAAPSHMKPAILDDTEVSVGLIQYAYKPALGDSSLTRRWHQRYVTLPTACWRTREAPQFVIVAHDSDHGLTWADGAAVLRWPSNRRSVTDDPNWDGLYVGTASRIEGLIDILITRS